MQINEYKMYNINQLRSKIFKALSDETRLHLLELFRDGQEICICNIEDLFGKSQSTISRHLKTLTEVDILEERKVGVKKLFKIKDPKIFKILEIADNLIKNNNKFREIVKLQEKIEV
ncbi:MAG: ArsR/SmtB family transcription factor [Promethearchaeia archaeon]